MWVLKSRFGDAPIVEVWGRKGRNYYHELIYSYYVDDSSQKHVLGTILLIGKRNKKTFKTLDELNDFLRKIGVEEFRG